VRRLVVGVKPVADVLPEALADASERRRQAMSVALEPIMTDSVRALARREGDLFGEILSPSIGSAVRKAVADAMAAILQRFNETLERSLSVQSLQWRIEALRTSRPFAEVVLAHTLIYRVEQVLLIHAHTGLVLQHVVAAGTPPESSDRIAGLLDAIDSFAREAFSPQPAGVHLHEIAVGDLVVWVDWDPTIAVAAVVRGVAPRDLMEVLRTTRERIGITHREDLASFVADVTPFARTRPELEQCLRQQRRAPRRLGQAVLAAFGVLCAVALGLVVARSRVQNAALRHYERALEGQPGIVLTSAERTHGRYRLVGFRDPLAADPAQVIAQHGYPPAELSFAAFQSLDPPIVEARARRALQLPQSAALVLADGVLHLSGSAPARWIERAQLVAPTLPGVASVDLDDLRPREELEELRATITDLEAKSPRFAVGSSQPGPGQEALLRSAATDARRILELAASVRLGACIDVIGVTDATGSAARNSALAIARASSVASILRGKGVEGASLRARPGGLARTRAAHFRVAVSPGANGCGHPLGRP
jgi:OOP family OmpA-OmpF porin